MALWKVQLGKHGEQETAAVEHNVVTIGWDELGNLSKDSFLADRDVLKIREDAVKAGKKVPKIVVIDARPSKALPNDKRVGSTRNPYS